MNSGIYQIKSPSGGFYVGSAVNFNMRWYMHKSHLRRGIHHSRALQRACNKYGLENLSFIRLLVCRPSDLLMFEQRAIDILKPNYNSCLIAGSRLGTKQSDEARAKMSANSPRRSPSKDQRERTAKSNRERVWSASAREKAASAKRGGKGSPGKRSPEFRTKISAIRTGKKPSNCFENIASDQIKSEIIALYASGKGTATLKKIYHTHDDAIRNIVIGAGIKIHPLGSRAKSIITDAKLIVSEYLDGKSVDFIVRKYGAGRREIRRVLISEGITIRASWVKAVERKRRLAKTLDSAPCKTEVET